MEHTNYDDIADLFETDLDCLSMEALIAEFFIEDLLDTPSLRDATEWE